MADAVTEIDLAGLRMSPGEGRKLPVVAHLDEIGLSESRYVAEPQDPETQVDVSRMLGGGFALRLRFETRITGPCMRCLIPAGAPVEVDTREHDQKASGDDQLDSPYVDGDTLKFGSWAHDSFVFAVPQQILCRDDCRGLCPVCGVNLNEHPDHAHDAGPDPRWAALSAISFDEDGNLVEPPPPAG